MGRKDTKEPFLAVSAGNMSGNITSLLTNCRQYDCGSYEVTWTGTAPVGELFVEVSNNPTQDPSTITAWQALDFGTTVPVTGNSGQHILEIPSFRFEWMRLRYARTSGTGTLNSYLTFKQVGG